MTFSITLEDVPFFYQEEQVLKGEIRIAEFSESFHAPLTYWNKDQYLKKWLHSFEHIKTNRNRAALVTSMRDPNHANFLFLWKMYLEDTSVYFQNSIFFLNEIDGPFDENKMAIYIKDRETHNEDGVKISEWKINIDEVTKYFSQLRSSIENKK